MAAKGQPKTGGRKKGTQNKATAEIKETAQQYGPAALEKLASLMENGKDERTQLAAARELLDRCHGRPAQSLDADVTVESNPLTEIMREIAEAGPFDDMPNCD